jgi:hypothetical protein
MSLRKLSRKPRVIFERITLGRAMARTLAEDSGLKCPHGCKGCSARWWGLVVHLVFRHAYSRKTAERTATRIMYGPTR